MKTKEVKSKFYFSYSKNLVPDKRCAFDFITNLYTKDEVYKDLEGARKDVRSYANKAKIEITAKITFLDDEDEQRN